jgi:predicted RNA-binding protein associated with RNAse of E/G family
LNPTEAVEQLQALHATGLISTEELQEALAAEEVQQVAAAVQQQQQGSQRVVVAGGKALALVRGGTAGGLSHLGRVP